MLDDNSTDTNSDMSSPPINSAPVQSEPAENTDVIQDIPKDPPPPSGDSEKAEKYLRQLIELASQDKLPVTHTDLKKFDVDSIQDHYRMDFNEYEVEVNHSKQPDTGQDFYILLFNNLKKIENAGESCVNKVILAYTHLTQVQFEDFKDATDALLERKRKKEEEKRFTDAMAPIDNILSNLSSAPKTEEPTVPEISDDKSDEPEQIEKPASDLADYTNEPKASDFPTPSQPIFS